MSLTLRLGSRVDRSPSGRPSSRARSRRRMILPLRVCGRSSENAISRGATAGPSRRAGEARAARGAAPRVGIDARLERDEGLHDLARHRVGHADHAGLGDGRVLHERALHLERADEVARGLDHVVGAADEPEVAVVVALREVAGQVPAVRRSTSVALLLVRGSRGTSTASRRRSASSPPRRRRARLMCPSGPTRPVLVAALQDRGRRCRAAAGPSSRAESHRWRSWRS